MTSAERGERSGPSARLGRPGLALGLNPSEVGPLIAESPALGLVGALLVGSVAEGELAGKAARTDEDWLLLHLDLDWTLAAE